MWSPPVGCAGFCEAALGGSQGQGVREDVSLSLKCAPPVAPEPGWWVSSGASSHTGLKETFSFPLLKGKQLKFHTFKTLCQSWASLGDRIFPGFPVGFPLEIHCLMGLPCIPQLVSVGSPAPDDAGEWIWVATDLPSSKIAPCPEILGSLVPCPFPGRDNPAGLGSLHGEQSVYWLVSVSALTLQQKVRNHECIPLFLLHSASLFFLCKPFTCLLPSL